MLACLAEHCTVSLLEDVQIFLEILQLPSHRLQSIVTGLLGVLLVQAESKQLDTSLLRVTIMARIGIDLFLMRLNRLEDWLEVDAFGAMIRASRNRMEDLIRGRPKTAGISAPLPSAPDSFAMLLAQMEEMETEQSALVDLVAKYERRLIELGEDPVRIAGDGACSVPAASPILVARITPTLPPPSASPAPPPQPSPPFSSAYSAVSHSVDV